MLKVPSAPWLSTQLGKWPLKEGEGSTGHFLGFINTPEQLGNLRVRENGTFAEFILPLSTTLKASVWGWLLARGDYCVCSEEWGYFQTKSKS